MQCVIGNTYGTYYMLDTVLVNTYLYEVYITEMLAYLMFI